MELDKTLSPYEKIFWKVKFISAAGAYDLYILFFEQALDLIAEGRLAAFITPNKYLSAPYANAYRNYIISRHQLVSLCDCSKLKVFDDPSVYPIISVVRKGKTTDNVYSIIVYNAINSEYLTAQMSIHGSSKLTILPDSLWGALLSSDYPFILRIT